MAAAPGTENIFAEAAALAANAYDDTADPDVARGWKPLDAASLGLPATGTSNADSFAFQNGIYTDTDSTNGAVAHVTIGEVNGAPTLAIAFRGTDEIPGDVQDHLHFTDHYAQFQPLMAAVQRYIDDPNHGVDRVLVTGHSLGSAMVTTAMIEQGWINDPKYLCVAIASHGTDASLAQTAPPEVTNLVNFVHTQDFLVLAKENGLPASTIGDLLGATPPVGNEADFEPKERVGIDVWIDTGNAIHLIQNATDGTVEDPITAEHRIGRYEADITTLAAQGELQPSTLLASQAPHYFAVGTNHADDFRQDGLFDGAALNRDFFPTKDFDQHIDTGAGDDAIGGSGGNDFIDGGTGNDTAYFRDVASNYTITSANGVTTVTPISADAKASDGTDTLVDVERLHFADREIATAGAPLAPNDTTDQPAITLDNLIHQPGVTLAGIGDEITDRIDHIL